MNESKSEPLSTESLTKLLRKDTRFDFAKILTLCGIAVLLIVNFMLLSRLAFIKFGDLDWGGFLDASWRVFRGQTIYKDFIYHSGPAHPYMNAFFFMVFGFGKNAILAHIVTLNTIVFLMVFAAAARRIPLGFALAAAFIQIAGFFWIYPHPYYDYTAHFWGIMSVCIFLLKAPFSSQAHAMKWGVAMGVCATLSLMIKLNVGLPYLAMMFCVLLIAPQGLRAAAAYLAGVAGVLLLIFIVVPFKNYYENVFGFADTQTNRLQLFAYLPVWFTNFFWLPMFLVWHVAAPYRWQWKEMILLCLGLGFLGIFTVVTGSFHGWDYLPMMGIYMAVSLTLLFRVLEHNPGRIRKLAAKIAIGLLCCVMIYQGTRLVGASIKKAITYDGIPPDQRYAMKAEPFRGWILEKSHGETIDRMVDFVKRNVRPNESLLILSEMQIVSALAGHDSLKGVPFHWFPGSVPAPGKQLLWVRSNILGQPPDWILTYRDGKPTHPINQMFAYLAIPLDFITNQYQFVTNWDQHAIFRRKSLLK